MALDETPMAQDAGHLADHAALKMAFDGLGVSGGPLAAYTSASTSAEHRRIHERLHSAYDGLGLTPTLPTTLSSRSVSHLAHHGALHHAYNVGQTPAPPPPATTNNGLVGFSPGGGFPYLSDKDLNADLDLMVACGATWLRLDLPRGVINTALGTYNWANSDRVISAATKKGLKILGLVFGTPAWDRPAGASDKFGPDNSTRLNNWAAFCTALAGRYDNTAVAAWEIWNEPNIPVFWQPAPNINNYVATLAAASGAFRAVRTSQPIITAGTSPALNQPTNASYPTYSPPDWLTRLYALGAGKYFDAVAHHPYCYPSLPTDGNPSWNAYQQVPVLRKTMVDNGDMAKKIWLTEYGAPTGTASDATTETKQTTIINDGFSNAITTWAYVGAVFNYALRDSGTNPSDREQNFGLVRYDYTAKQALSGFSALSTLSRPTS